MTFELLSKIIEENDIPKNVLLQSDSGWEGCETDMDGIYYNRETNTVIFTQTGNIYDSWSKKPEWTRLYSIDSQEDLEEDEDEEEEDEEEEDYNPIDIYNSRPRKIRCIRNDDNVWGGGGENAHLLEIGKVYNLTDVEVHGWHTLIWLAEFSENYCFNSVLFEELDGDEED